MTALAVAKKRTLGQVADELGKKRAEITALNKQVKDLTEQAEALEAEFLGMADAEDTTRAGGKGFNAQVSDEVYPQVEDWDKFYQYLHKHKYYHLLQRRPAVEACRELFETKGAIPGVQKFTKRKVKTTAL